VNDFQTYDQSLLYHNNPYLAQQQTQPHPQQQQSPPLEDGRTPLVGIPQVDNPNGVVSSEDFDNNDQNGNRSSSEEKESLTPAQSRRKAQNRAAYEHPLTNRPYTQQLLTRTVADNGRSVSAKKSM